METYKTKDPYKVALLLCLGAEIESRETDDPENIVFTLKRENIREIVDAIHSGELGKYGEYAHLLKFSEHHKEIMRFIREIRLNRKGGVK